ncbi:MAG: hypothetical protein Q8P52_01260 [bacterium]|nr:hypothetical protein [bacterium]
MNPRYITILVLAILILGGGFAYIYLSSDYKPSPSEKTENGKEDAVFCTQDAKECLDGSFVGRVSPDCRFKLCPDGTDVNESPSTTSPKGDSEEGVENVTEDGMTIVTYTNDGFSPKTITINQGDTVRFVNQGSLQMWVASAIHPTHTIYPEKTEDDCLGSAFDQCEAGGAGSVYEFTFNRVGSWNYHNHSRANHTGSIIVK